MASLKPLHPVDLLDRRTDNEVCRTVEATAQHDRFAIDCGSPCGGGGWRGLRDRGALIAAEPLWQRLNLAWTLFFAAMGVVNLIVVLPVSTVWLVGVALAPSVASAPRRVTSVVALACGPPLRGFRDCRVAGA